VKDAIVCFGHAEMDALRFNVPPYASAIVLTDELSRNSQPYTVEIDL
jgi:hypothetical protein